MNEPAVVLLDEPSSGLDLAGREQLVEALDHLAGDSNAPPLVVVTHHVEDVPTSLTHAMLMRAGSRRRRRRVGRDPHRRQVERHVRPRPATRTSRGRAVQCVGVVAEQVGERRRAAAHLVVEDPAEHVHAPQLAGVLQVHRQVGAAIGVGHLRPSGSTRRGRVRRPRRARTCTSSLSTNCGANHPQLLRPRERPDPGAQLDPPRRALVVRWHRRHPVDEAHPRRVAVERGDLLEQQSPCSRQGTTR